MNNIYLNGNCAYHFAAWLPIEYSARVMQALNRKFSDVYAKLALGQAHMIEKYKIDRQSELQMSLMKMFLETDSMPASVAKGRPNLEQAVKVLKYIKDGMPDTKPKETPKPTWTPNSGKRTWTPAWKRWRRLRKSA